MHIIVDEISDPDFQFRYRAERLGLTLLWSCTNFIYSVENCWLNSVEIFPGTSREASDKERDITVDIILLTTVF